MNDALKILITGQLDMNATETTIKSQLSQISKDLKIDIGINNKQFSQMAEEVKKLKSQLNDGKQSNLISSKDFSSMDKLIEKYKLLGTTKIDKKINPVTKEVEGLNIAVTKANGQVEKLKYELAKLKGITGLDKMFVQTGHSVSDNTAAIREKQLQSEQKINREVDSQNSKLKHQLELYKQEAKLKAQNLINANKGNSKFDSAGVNSWLSSVNKLNTSAPKLNQNMDNLNMKFKQISADAKQASINTNNFGSSLQHAFLNLGKYAAASALFFAPFQALRSFIDTLYVLDERLISIEKVSDNANMEDVFNNATAAADKFGQTIDASLESLGEISKLGFNQKDAEALNSNAMLLSTVGEFRSNTDAASALVAIMRQYKLSVEETTGVVDALNSVSNQTGADTVSLAEGLSKSSSTAAMAGVSFHELNGMLANSIEVLKIGGQEAGTFYKALFSRYMRDDTQKMIQGLGIETNDLNGEMRSATDVLAELGSQYDTYSSQQKNSIAQTLGGVYHINKVSSLLENQANVLKNTGFSIESYGSATQELETFQDGLRFKTNEMIASFQELAQSVGENGVGAALVLFLETVTFMTKGFTELTEETHGLNIYLPLLAVGIYGGVKAFQALKVAAIGAKASLGVFGLAIVGVELFATAVMGAKKATEVNTESLTETAKATAEQKTQLEGLIAKYNELSPQAKGNAEKQDELHNTLKQIQAIAPHLIKSTGDYGDKLTLNKQKTDDYINSLKAMTSEQVAQAQNANMIEMNAVSTDIDEVKKELNATEEKTVQSLDIIANYRKKHSIQAIEDAKSEFNERVKLYGEEIAQASASGNTKKVKALEIDFEDAKNEYETYIQLVGDVGGKQEKYAENLSKLQELEGKQTGLKERDKALQDLTNTTNKSADAVDSLSNVNGEATDKLTAYSDEATVAEGATDSLGSAADTTASAYEKYSQELANSVNIQNQNASASEMLAGITSSQIDSIYEQVAVYQLLSQQENLNEQQKLLLGDAMNFLSGIYPHLVEGSEANIDAILRETQANDILLEAVSLAAKGQLSSQENQTLNSALGAKSRIEILKAEILAVDKMVQAYKQAAIDTYNAAAEIQNESGMLEAEKAYKRADVAGDSEISYLNDEIEKLIPDFEKYTGTLGKNIDYQGRTAEATEKAAKSSGNAGKSAKEANKEYKNSIYVADKFKEAIEKVNLALAKQQAIQSKYPQYSKQFRNALKEEIKQLEKKEKLLSDQAKSLKEQIKSGKIKDTGIVETTGNYTGNAGSKVSGTHSSTINSASSKYGIDAALVKAVATQESQLGKASSNVMQVNGYNGKGAVASINKGTQMLASLLKKTNGDVKEALAAYNMGEGILSYFKKNGGYSVQNMKNFSAIQKKKYGYNRYGDPNYVNNVMRYYNGGSSGSTSTKSSKSKNVADYYLNNFRVSGDYQESRTGRAHKGLDLSNGKSGSPVKSLKGGKVITASYSKSAGYWVVVEQDDGKVAKYMHMQKDSLKVKAGQRIEAGQQLGNIGNTGDSHGAHLHLQIESGGKLVDPEDYLKELQSDTSKAIAEDASNVADAQSDVLSLEEEMLAVEQQIQELRMELIQSNLSYYDHQRKELEDDLRKVDLQMQYAGEGTDEWIKLQLKKEKLLAKEIGYQKNSIKYLKDEIKNNKELTAAQKATLNEELIDRTSELYDLESQLLSEREAMAEQAIDAFKQALEAQKEAAVKAIDKMIDAINKEANEEDYAKNLADAQSDRQKTLDEISKWSMDSSPEALKKLQELNEQLQDQDEAIADMQTDRERELRIDNLNEEKEKVESNYDNLINDEKKFAQMRSDIINGNADKIVKDLKKYGENIAANTDILGKAVANNLIDLINQANKYLNGKDYKPIKVAQAKEGGILPSWSSNNGRLMYVHPNEMISNKADTQNILAASKILSGTLNQPQSLLNVPLWKNSNSSSDVTNNNNSTSGNTYNNNMTVHIGNITGDEAGTRTMLSRVLDGVSTFVK
ncbi:phage tail tape measure protein [Peribacillus sp. NPDC097198]|uniref:phage tail tape measure protein n=1 Tax=Peribacillus sp. NPDC097198 TaxID=3364397 RepID=UPI003808BAC3